MTRYAKVGFEPMQLRAGGVSSNAGSVAGAVSTGSLYAAQAGSSPDFGELTEAADIAVHWGARGWAACVSLRCSPAGASADSPRPVASLRCVRARRWCVQ